jgi:hypothetical protein
MSSYANASQMLGERCSVWWLCMPGSRQNGFWIDSWLHYTVNCYTLVSAVTSSLTLLGSGFQRKTLTLYLCSPTVPRPRRKRISHYSKLYTSRLIFGCLAVTSLQPLLGSGFQRKTLTLYLCFPAVPRPRRKRISHYWKRLTSRLISGCLAVTSLQPLLGSGFQRKALTLNLGFRTVPRPRRKRILHYWKHRLISGV